MDQDEAEIWLEARGYPSPGAVAVMLTWVCLHLFAALEISSMIDAVAADDGGTADPLNGDELLMVQQLGLEVNPKYGRGCEILRLFPH